MGPRARGLGGVGLSVRQGLWLRAIFSKPTSQDTLMPAKLETTGINLAGRLGHLYETHEC